MTKVVRLTNPCIGMGLKRMLLLAGGIALLLATMARADVNSGMVFESHADDAGQVVIEGSSNVKDWEAVGQTIQGRIVMGTAPDAAEELSEHWLTEIPKVNVAIPVRGLSSDGGRGMDRAMYAALEARDHPEITYKLTSLERPAEDAEIPAEGFSVVAGGELTIAGKTRTIQIPATITVKEDGLRIKGTADLKMTDFGIDPPRALLGALRTRNEVRIRFSWLLSEAAR